MAISGGDNQVHVMAEDITGEWKEVQTINEDRVKEGGNSRVN